MSRQEQIQRQVSKQRRPQENYEAPFPVPVPDETELQALGDLALEHIDEELAE